MRRRMLFLVAGGLLLGASLLMSPGVGAGTPDPLQVVTWAGNGTNPDGTCGASSEGLTGVPAGEQGWLFILTSPGTGPWTLTADFAGAGTQTAEGTQQGNGAVHFVVFTLPGDTLTAASATNGTTNSVLTVSGCTVNGTETGGGGGTTTTTTSATTTTAAAGTTTTSAGATTTTEEVVIAGGGGGSTTTTSAPSGEFGVNQGPVVAGATGGSNAASGTSAASGAGHALVGATTVHTGEPWAGSRPFVVGTAVLGMILVTAGLLTRRRPRRAD